MYDLKELKKTIKKEIAYYYNDKNIDLDELLDYLESFINTPAVVSTGTFFQSLPEEFFSNLSIVYNNDINSINTKNSCKQLTFYEDFLRKVLFFKDPKRIKEYIKSSALHLLKSLELIPPDPNNTTECLWLDEANTAHVDEIKNYKDTNYEYNLITAYRLRNANAHKWESMNQRDLMNARDSITIFYLEVINKCKKYLDNKLILPEESVEYYANYVDKNGIPCGVRKLTLEQVHKRSESYKFIVKNHKLVKVIHINSKENPTETNGSLNDPLIQEILYSDDKTIKIKCMNCVGKVEFIKEYKRDISGNFNRVNFYNGNESASFHLPSKTTMDSYFNPFDIDTTKAQISGWKLERNDDGFIKRKLYLRFHNDDIRQADSDGIFGQEYELNELGLPTKIFYLGKSGEQHRTKDGRLGEKFIYDDKNEIISHSIFSVNERPIFYSKIEKDEIGNILVVDYYDLYDKRISKYKYKYNNDGQIEEIRYFDSNNSPNISDEGFHKMILSYDINGYRNSEALYGLDGNPIIGEKYGAFFSKVKWERNEKGFITKVYYYDEYGNLFDGNGGTAIIMHEYDLSGNITASKYYDINQKLTLDINDYAIERHKYDKDNRIIESLFFDENGNSKKNIYGYSSAKFCYYKGENAENIEEITCYDTTGKMVDSVSGYSKVKRIYDERGLLVDNYYYNKDDKPPVDGIAHQKNDYNNEGQRIKTSYFDSGENLYSCKHPDGTSWAVVANNYNKNEVFSIYKNEKDEPILGINKEYNEFGNLIKETEYNYTSSGEKFVRCLNQRSDILGNVVERFITNAEGQLQEMEKGGYRMKITYNERNWITSIKYYDKDDKLINLKGHNWAYFTRELDEMGNVAEQFYFDKDNNPVKKDREGCYGYKTLFDSFGRPTRRYYLGRNRKPILINSYLIGSYLYVNMNYLHDNNVEQVFVDKNNKIIWKEINSYEKKDEGSCLSYFFHGGMGILAKERGFK